MTKRSPVRISIQSLTIPTYLPAPPDKNPMFLEKRVYQGSSGKVYPLPFTDRIAEEPVDRRWKAVWIENEFLRAMVLPELGGRIHILQDKTNGYDLIYNQHVIKPALVGLAGPWVSGGIELNWPQHHRPATFLPVDFRVEAHADGSRTVWCGDHDPMTRMKGMHGVCLHPGRAVLELKVRVCNRTPFVQTFLWWANVATRVHEAYQSFFPPDVYYVADHARRSMSEYPLAKGVYYGVNYGDRKRMGVPQNEIPSQFVPPRRRRASEILNCAPQIPGYAPNDLRFYANIPTPCSYMCMGSREDFFGGYDYKAQAGIIHIADHHIAPGKKQWTWGNHEFGYAWDRHLTDASENGEHAPYIEIMAGVYTDNQPDFSFLHPGETKTWSQFWYPIQQIGPAQHANIEAAVSLRRCAHQSKVMTHIGVSVTKNFSGAKLRLMARGRTAFSTRRNLAPDKPFVTQISLPRGIVETNLLLRVLDSSDHEIISYQPKPRVEGNVPPPASEPPAPEEIASSDELFVTGLHLEQYRHATRCPTLYWQEALRRDPLDSRCNNALGLWHLKRGDFVEAENRFRKAIQRLTRRNANPYDGEAFYNLGLCLRFQLNAIDDRKCEALKRTFEDAYAAFYKATWNQSWAGASFHALAEMDCCRRDWTAALDHLKRSLRFDTDNLRARNLEVIVLRKLNRRGEAETLLRETLALDPLDCWARYLHERRLHCDLNTALDLAHDFARAGLFGDAVSPLREIRGEEKDLPDQSLGVLPLVQYTLGWLHEKMDDRKSARQCFKRAAALAPDYCFPSRLEEIAVLESAMRLNPRDAKAPYYLGNLLYDRRRHAEAIRLWEKSARLDAGFSIVWRNLGIGYFNVLENHAESRAAYERAFQANPADARLLFERDQLWKRLGEEPARRMRELEKNGDLIVKRDDLTVELCALLNQSGRFAEAAQLLARRAFQPWEGGEGGPLAQHVRAQLALGREAFERHDYRCAANHFEQALVAPRNLGEARHLLANQSNAHYWAGMANQLLGERAKAEQHWLTAATFEGDFQSMSVRAFSEMTFYSALSCEQLGRKKQAKQLLGGLLAFAERLRLSQAKIDYFATSLPTLLLFEDDPRFRQETTALLLQAQALLGLGKKLRAKSLLRNVLQRDPNHALAADLLGEFFQRKGKS